jgi:hypothetical protein
VICLGTVYGNIDIHASDKSVRLKLCFSYYNFVFGWVTKVGSFYKACGVAFPFDTFG